MVSSWPPSTLSRRSFSSFFPWDACFHALIPPPLYSGRKNICVIPVSGSGDTSHVLFLSGTWAGNLNNQYPNCLSLPPSSGILLAKRMRSPRPRRSGGGRTSLFSKMAAALFPPKTLSVSLFLLPGRFPGNSGNGKVMTRGAPFFDLSAILYSGIFPVVVQP